MIEVRSDRDSPEEKAAQHLKKLIEADLARSNGSEHLRGLVLPSFQAFGQKRRDMDIVLALDDRNETPIFWSGKNKRAFRSLCLTIEIKRHGPEDVIFEGNKCFVTMMGETHNVTMQSDEQIWSLQKYLSKHSYGKCSPYIDNLIWLTETPKELIPSKCVNILGSDSNWQDFLNALDNSTRSSRDEYQAFPSRQFEFFREIAVKEIIATKIDRKKLKTITKAKLDAEEQQYASEFGEKTIAFRGRGGTGKTVRLLQIAYQLWNERQARILILTYNRALRSDIERILILMGIKGTVGTKSLAIRSIYSFMGHWFHAFEDVLPASEQDSNGDFANYEPSKKMILGYLKDGLITPGDIADAKRDKSLELLWDYVFIDESQDWPENERDLIFHLYGAKNIVLADGIDQLARSPDVTNWMEQIPTSDRRIINLRKSLRMKGRLCTFAGLLADKFDYDVWDLQPETEIHGGTIKIVLEADLYKCFRAAIETTKKDGNQTVDNLVCVPPGWSSEANKTPNFIEELRGVDFKVWDGTSTRVDDRDEPPTDHDQLRVVSYDSCRGLEGWCTIAVAIDEFFDYKLKNPELPTGVKDDLFFAQEKEGLELEYAVKWLMIPMTRAIDTVYLHVADANSVLGKILLDLAETNPELVEVWEDNELINF